MKSKYAMKEDNVDKAYGPVIPTDDAAVVNINPMFELSDDSNFGRGTSTSGSTQTTLTVSSNNSTIDKDGKIVQNKRAHARIIHNGELPNISGDEEEKIGESGQEYEEELEFEESCYYKCTQTVHQGLSTCCVRHKTVLKIVVYILLLLLYAAYFIYAIIHSFTRAIPLIVLTVICVLICVLYMIYIKCGTTVYKSCLEPCGELWDKVWVYLRWVFMLLVLAAVGVFIGLDLVKDMSRLKSLSGLAFLVLISYITSKNPARIKWRPVAWGFALQMIFGLVVLRWNIGLMAIRWLADQVVTFLTYADKGSEFVFGPDFVRHPFAFQSMPVVIFFSSIISILYYIGFLQSLVKIIALFMEATLGTTALESLASASNIFVSYAPAAHLISACIISAPAGLAIAKISYPETKKSHTRTIRDVHLPDNEESNFVAAAANGAMVAIKLVAGICACLIAFLGIVAFLDAVLAWLGSMVGVEELSFQKVCSYLFYPLTIMMGVDIENARRVSGMLGLKIFVDEVLCYQDLGEAVKAGEITNRSAVIATYACCGFGSLGAIGVALGAMLAIAPERQRKVITELIPRAFVNGNIAAFMTACIAGLLYEEDIHQINIGIPHNSTTTPWPMSTLSP